METQSNTTSLRKALLVLLSFTPYRLEWGTNEIARNVRISKATAHRILMTLTEFGMVERDVNTGKYKIGPELYLLGSLYLNNLNVIEVASPVSKMINELTGETVLMGIFDKGNVVMILKEESRYAFRFALHVGSYWPAHASAIGKAFLSEMTEAELDRVYPEEELKRVAPGTITTKTGLKQNLEQIRKVGISFANEEGFGGDVAVACLIRNARGQAVAGMAIAVPIFRINQARKNQLATLVKLGCSLISYKLGYRDTHNPVQDIQEILSWWERNKVDAIYQFDSVEIGTEQESR